MNNERSIASLIWTILVILGIVLFWRQIIYLVLFLIVVVIAIVVYFYYRLRKSTRIYRTSAQHLYEEAKLNEEPTKTTREAKSTVMDAEFTVKSKEID